MLSIVLPEVKVRFYVQALADRAQGSDYSGIEGSSLIGSPMNVCQPDR
jgi:hypothetical protein